METSRQKGSLVIMETPAQAGRREWIGLAVLALACVLYAMDPTVLHLAAAISATGAAILAVVFLRHVPARTQAEGQPEADAYDAAIVELDELEAEHAA
jgi:hypothetical protein